MNAIGKPLFPKKHRTSDEMSLQITSMADIFTILLVFLLKSFSTSSVDLSPSAGITLPNAGGESTHYEALKIEIGPTGVVLENALTLTLKDYTWASGELETNGTLRTLNTALEKARKRQLLIAEKNTSVKVDSKVLVVADQKTPYATLKAVLASLAVNGFTDFKLAVVKADS